MTSFDQVILTPLLDSIAAHADGEALLINGDPIPTANSANASAPYATLSSSTTSTTKSSPCFSTTISTPTPPSSPSGTKGMLISPLTHGGPNSAT